MRFVVAAKELSWIHKRFLKNDGKRFAWCSQCGMVDSCNVDSVSKYSI